MPSDPKSWRVSFESLFKQREHCLKATFCSSPAMLPFYELTLRIPLTGSAEIRNRFRISGIHGLNLLEYALCSNEVGLPIGTHGINGYSF